MGSVLPKCHAKIAGLSLEITDCPDEINELQQYENQMPDAVFLTWLNGATNGGVAFQRYIETGGRRIPGGVTWQDSIKGGCSEKAGSFFRYWGRWAELPGCW